MFDVADLKCEEVLVSTCSIPKNVVVFTHLIAVKFEATLGCIDYLFGKFCVILFIVCIFFFGRSIMLIMNCLQNKELIHWHILHYLKRNCFLLW